MRQLSLEKPPDLDPVFDDLARAKSAKELKEHLETRVLRAFLLTQVLRKGPDLGASLNSLERLAWCHSVEFEGFVPSNFGGLCDQICAA